MERAIHKKVGDYDLSFKGNLTLYSPDLTIYLSHQSLGGYWEARIHGLPSVDIPAADLVQVSDPRGYMKGTWEDLTKRIKEEFDHQLPTPQEIFDVL